MKRYLLGLGSLTVVGGGLTAWVVRRPDSSYAVLWTTWGLHVTWAASALGGLGCGAWRLSHRRGGS